MCSGNLSVQSVKEKYPARAFGIAWLRIGQRQYEKFHDRVDVRVATLMEGFRQMPGIYRI
jgi:hypothetical protein